MHRYLPARRIGDRLTATSRLQPKEPACVLHISGSQLDAGGVVRGRTAGYGLTGFNASSIYFSGQGCYRVTGRAGVAALSLVTLVRTCSVLPELSPRQGRVVSENLTKNWCPA